MLFHYIKNIRIAYIGWVECYTICFWSIWNWNSVFCCCFFFPVVVLFCFNLRHNILVQETVWEYDIFKVCISYFFKNNTCACILRQKFTLMVEVVWIYDFLNQLRTWSSLDQHITHTQTQNKNKKNKKNKKKFPAKMRSFPTSFVFLVQNIYRKLVGD